MRLAGGIVVALGVAAPLAGRGLAVAAGIALVLALLATALPDHYGRPHWDRPWVGPGWAELQISRVRMITLLPLVSVYAHAFAVYVVPGHPKIASAGLILVAVALNNSAYWISPALRMVVVSLLIVGAVTLVGAGLSARPGLVPAGEQWSAGEQKPWWAVFLAALALLPLLVPRPGELRWGKFLLSALLGAALGVAAVRLLGTDLSITYLKDLLVAADGAFLGTVLVVFVGIATVTATVDVVADAALEFLDWEDTAAILATIAFTVFAPPAVLLVTAGIATSAWAAFRFYIEYLAR
ncbi:hypothetical protein BBK82_35235 [Lentzea guizhouensis]|uniref:Uncharacterized protein n=1 Tax=Lentzea guizhouensis TaxID=1586287 RepID=A0A1B2HRW9_9PSEU|nr:hypothetical protein [Lentzea guizhouensis]ANZ40490.1 hypothetical protein BBK82_35235 [Lentzea guizhouensis]